MVNTVVMVMEMPVRMVRTGDNGSGDMARERVTFVWVGSVELLYLQL